MYYHLIVETNEKNKKGDYVFCYEFDCTDFEEILDLVVKPYSKKEQIYVDGKYIESKNIRSLKIKSSEEKTNELCDIAQRNLSPNIVFFYTPTHIVNSADYVTDITKDTLKKFGGILRTNTTAGTSPVDKNKVFIVHGRDDAAKNELARFIERLGLKPIILHEQASSGKTIIEKIEAHTNVGFAIVLYTPCDIGGLAQDNSYKPRARQNVVFEHGYLIAKLGRENVCALVKGDVEIPGDIDGVVYEPFDSRGAWRIAVVNEMCSSGYAIDMNDAFGS